MHGVRNLMGVGKEAADANLLCESHLVQMQIMSGLPDLFKSVALFSQKWDLCSSATYRYIYVYFSSLLCNFFAAATYTL